MNQYKINVEQVLSYMGYHGQQIDLQLMETIERCIHQVEQIMVPRMVGGTFKIESVSEGILVKDTTLILTGDDIRRHLEGCEACILMAATLGNQVDREINRVKEIRLTEAVIMDAAATAAIEMFCDEKEEKFRQEHGPLTARFSCGYGDLPLTLQPDFLRVLDAHRRIGLTTGDNCIMIPAKSVTAIMGIGVERSIGKSCTDCVSRDHCALRKAGKHCGH